MPAFSTLLRQAMTKRQARRADIYRPLGACSTSVKQWLDGTVYPDHGTVVAIADILSWPSLVDQSIRDRSGVCEGCGKPTMATRGKHPPRYCGDRCIRRLHDRQRRDAKRLQVVGVVARERDRLREAVAAFCASCTAGESICREEDCELRSVSPLPWVPLSEVSRRRAA